MLTALVAAVVGSVLIVRLHSLLHPRKSDDEVPNGAAVRRWHFTLPPHRPVLLLSAAIVALLLGFATSWPIGMSTRPPHDQPPEPTTASGNRQLDFLPLLPAGGTESLLAMARGEHGRAPIYIKLFFLEMGRLAYSLTLAPEKRIEILDLLNEIWLDPTEYYAETTVTVKGPIGSHVLRFPVVAGINKDGCAKTPLAVEVSGRLVSDWRLRPLSDSPSVFCVLEVPVDLLDSNATLTITWSELGRSAYGPFSVTSFDFGPYAGRIRRFVKRVHFRKQPTSVAEWRWTPLGRTFVVERTPQPLYEIQHLKRALWKASPTEEEVLPQTVFHLELDDPVGPAAPVLTFTLAGYEFLHEPDRTDALTRIAAAIMRTLEEAGPDGQVAIVAACEQCDGHEGVIDALEAAGERVHGAWLMSPAGERRAPELLAALRSHPAIECRVSDLRAHGLTPGFWMQGTNSSQFWSSAEPGQLFDVLRFMRAWYGAKACTK